MTMLLHRPRSNKVLDTGRSNEVSSADLINPDQFRGKIRRRRVSVKTDPKKAQEIGRRIVEARQEAGGMTQRELGELIGVSERSIAAYEAGEVVPYRFLRKLEEALGKPAAWILHGEEVPVQGDGRILELLERQHREILDQLSLLRLELQKKGP